MKTSIHKATIEDIYSIIKIAEITWPATYLSIIGEAQLTFMLASFYSYEYLKTQIDHPDHIFLIYSENEIPIGYAHCLPTDNNHTYKLSKLYILPNYQGKKIGSQLLNACYKILISKNIERLCLNVNRYNPAKLFYEKQGFKIIESVDIPLDRFWLNDYVMQKEI